MVTTWNRQKRAGPGQHHPPSKSYLNNQPTDSRYFWSAIELPLNATNMVTFKKDQPLALETCSGLVARGNFVT